MINHSGRFCSTLFWVPVAGRRIRGETDTPSPFESDLVGLAFNDFDLSTHRGVEIKFHDGQPLCPNLGNP